MEQRKVGKRTRKLSGWRVFARGCAFWMLILLAYFCFILGTEAVLAIKAHVVEAYTFVSRQERVVFAGIVGFILAILTAIYDCYLMAKAEKRQNPKKVEKKKQNSKNASTGKATLEGELYIEPRDDDKMSEAVKMSENDTEETVSVIRKRRRHREDDVSEEMTTAEEHTENK